MPDTQERFGIPTSQMCCVSQFNDRCQSEYLKALKYPVNYQQTVTRGEYPVPLTTPQYSAVSTQSLHDKDLQSHESAAVSSDCPATTESQTANQCQLKSKRNKFHPIQIRVLMQEFAMNQRPDRFRRRELAKRLNLTVTQVTVWFQNRRSARPPKTKEATQKDDKLPLPIPFAPPKPFVKSPQNDADANVIASPPEQLPPVNPAWSSFQHLPTWSGKKYDPHLISSSPVQLPRFNSVWPSFLFPHQSYPFCASSGLSIPAQVIQNEDCVPRGPQ